jgi:plasmid stability protein
MVLAYRYQPKGAIMPDILIRGVDPIVVNRLKERAARFGTSLQHEAKMALESTVKYTWEEFLEVARAERESTRGTWHLDSTQLIREGRDER